LVGGDQQSAEQRDGVVEALIDEVDGVTGDEDASWTVGWSPIDRLK
jgi:hypothetical protein